MSKIFSLDSSELHCKNDYYNPLTTKIVISIRSFLQILYHSITTKVVAINIQALEE